MEKIGLIYSTFKSRDDALKALTTLMDEKLASCGNIFAPHLAVYPWQGERVHEEETAALIKAPTDKLEACMARLRQIHPYELPCILQIKAKALPDYAAWLSSSLS